MIEPPRIFQRKITSGPTVLDFLKAREDARPRDTLPAPAPPESTNELVELRAENVKLLAELRFARGISKARKTLLKKARKPWPLDQLLPVNPRRDRIYAGARMDFEVSPMRPAKLAGIDFARLHREQFSVESIRAGRMEMLFDGPISAELATARSFSNEEVWVYPGMNYRVSIVNMGHVEAAPDAVLRVIYATL